MSSFFDWVNSLWAWVVAYFDASIAFLKDLPVLIWRDFLDALATLIESIPAPDFLQGASMGSMLSSLPSGVLFFLDRSGLPEGMTILAAAFAFRMVRKFVTLFQW